ncbi:hypothetical protein RS030_192881 [Cryptosporidium xiaoi]|uniref:Selenoprotein n=1 Tax=Cryptosporidium xiaoi TaxID=659607 RepID=A0AAV9XZQ0_9CRYT
MTVTNKIKELLLRTGLFEDTLKLSLTVLALVVTMGFCYYLYLRKRNENIKRVNDMRMKRIREKQMEKWEKERNECLLNPDLKEKDDNINSGEDDDSKRKKQRSNNFSRFNNNNNHLNPHFSYISTYKPSVSKRYPCKKCCG